MAAIPIPPPWIQRPNIQVGGQRREPKLSSTVWRPGMESPNPAGRPRGIVDARTKLTRLLADNSEEVLRGVVNDALKGNAEARALIVARVCPPLRATDERVSFSFDKDAPLASQIEQVLQAIADGEVSPGTGKTLIETLGQLAQVRQLDVLLARVAELEKLLSEKQK